MIKFDKSLPEENMKKCPAKLQSNLARPPPRALPRSARIFEGRRRSGANFVLCAPPGDYSTTQVFILWCGFGRRRPRYQTGFFSSVINFFVDVFSFF